LDEDKSNYTTPTAQESTRRKKNQSTSVTLINTNGRLANHKTIGENVGLHHHTRIRWQRQGQESTVRNSGTRFDEQWQAREAMDDEQWTTNFDGTSPDEVRTLFEPVATHVMTEPGLGEIQWRRPNK